MELYWLKYFQTIARIGSVSRAAEQIHISQPALSKTLSQLEEELGVRLFDRVGRNIVLNRYGESFLKNTNEILNRLENARMELERIKMDSVRRLVVCINTGNKYISNRLLDFINHHPEIRVELVPRPDSTQDLDRCDVIITYESPDIPESWDSILLYDEEIVALASQKQFPEFHDRIRLADCGNLYFSLPERTARMGDLRDLYDAVFHACGYAPKVIHQSTSVDQVRTQLMLDRCITLVPFGITTIMDTTDICVLKLEDYPLTRKVCAYWTNQKKLSEDASALVECLKTDNLLSGLQ